jgi:hypothetical protein
MSVNVDVGDMPKHPGWLDEGQKLFLERSSERLGDSIRENAPGGKNGSIAKLVDDRVLTSTLAQIVVRSPGHVFEVGAYIRPKRGKALKFRDGRFSRGAVRIRPTKFATRGLRPRRRIINEAYSEGFRDLKRHSVGI